MRKFLLLAVILGLCPLANASTARRANLSELTKHASLVAIGTVASKSSAWETTRIYTTSEVLLEEIWLQGDTVDPSKLALKGKTPSISVKTLGGVVGDIGQTVAGSPNLIQGQTYLLFLTETAPKSYAVVGLSQGAFKVDGDRLIQLSNQGGMKLVGSATPIPNSKIKFRDAIIHSVRATQ